LASTPVRSQMENNRKMNIKSAVYENEACSPRRIVRNQTTQLLGANNTEVISNTVTVNVGTPAGSASLREYQFPRRTTNAGNFDSS
jgi:hypothetical protein